MVLQQYSFKNCIKCYYIVVDGLLNCTITISLWLWLRNSIMQEVLISNNQFFYKVITKCKYQYELHRPLSLYR